MALSRSVNIPNLLASSVAGIIGSGWLLGPLACAKAAGPAAIICWIIAGLLMMVVAATFVVLTRISPLTGGTVRFFQLHYGHFAGFSFAWVNWLAWVAVPPIETMALLQYGSNYLPGLMTTGSRPVLTMTGVLVAIALVVFINGINRYGMRVYSRVNQFILAFKLLIPVLTVILLLSQSFHAENWVAQGGFMPYGIQSIFAAMPLAGVIYAFVGFNPAVQLAAEVKNVKVAIPVAIFGALAICMVLYTLIQVAFIMALPAGALAHGWQQVSYIGDNGPFAGLLAMMGLAWFVKALYLDAAISPFGTALVQAMATSRLTYGMSQNGYFPKGLQKLNVHGSPARAMWLNTLVGCLFFLPFPSWQHMVGFLVSCLVLGYVVGPMSLLSLSYSQCQQFPANLRRYLHVLCLSAFYICNLIIFWTGWATIAKLSLVFTIGYGLLAGKMLWDKARQQTPVVLHVTRGSWVLFYMVGMVTISYLSSFGGHNVIPFGSDFMVIAIFTLAIYLMAYTLVSRTQAPEVLTR